ncbi:MAG: SDR family oxidoreductase [Sneathiellales bacterium]|nr:SDR family oxidoreductase [Sneathiellales bacterium]
MTDRPNLAGKTALVTGASQGIGFAISEKLAAQGAHVFMLARNKSALEEATTDLKEKGYSVASFSGDVSQYENVKMAVSTCLETKGSLDILVNNAGVIDPISLLAESDPDAWGKAVDINLKGVYFGLRAVLPVMTRQGAGTIINISSGAANSILEGWSHYCSTKAAAKKLTEIAHKETANPDIHIIGLSPGSVATQMMKKIKASNVNPVSQLDWDSHISPEWVGEAVLFLCGPGGSHYSGTDFSIKTPEGRKAVGLPMENTADA